MRVNEGSEQNMLSAFLSPKLVFNYAAGLPFLDFYIIDHEHLGQISLRAVVIFPVLAKILMI